MRCARRGISGPRKSSGTSPTASRKPECQRRGNPYRKASSRSVSPVVVGANAGSATNNSMSSCRSTGPCTWASIWVSSTRPAGRSAGSFLGLASSLRTSSKPATVTFESPSVGARKGGQGGAAIPPASISPNSAAMTLSIWPIIPSRSVARGSSLPANVNEVRLTRWVAARNSTTRNAESGRRHSEPAPELRTWGVANQ